MTKNDAFLEWYNNAHWGNEDLKECCHRSWNAAIKQALSTRQTLPDEITDNSETPEYRSGWNDCRQLMREMMK